MTAVGYLTADGECLCKACCLNPLIDEIDETDDYIYVCESCNQPIATMGSAEAQNIENNIVVYILMEDEFIEPPYYPTQMGTVEDWLETMSDDFINPIMLDDLPDLLEDPQTWKKPSLIKLLYGILNFEPSALCASSFALGQLRKIISTAQDDDLVYAASKCVYLLAPGMIRNIRSNSVAYHRFMEEIS